MTDVAAPSHPSALPAVQPARQHPAARRAVRGGIMGNFVDQFDIFLPIIALAPAAGHLYGSENMVANAGLIFIATLVGRPLGAAVFGPLADRIGRSRTTQVTIAGVALTTLLIAAVPAQSVLGPGTLLLIVALRFLGGIFIGGGYTAAVPLAMEWAPPRRRGLVSGLIMWMSPWANASIAALVFALLGALGAARYADWGWRVPFVLGGLMAVALLVYYRSRVVDIPVTDAPVPARPRHPLREILFGAYRKQLWQVFVLMSGMWLFTNMAVAVLSGQLKTSEALDDQSVALTMFVATAVSAVTMAACGQVSTVVGRRRFFVGFGLVAAVLAPVLYLAIFRHGAGPGLMLLVVGLQVVTVSVYGPVGAYLTERFPVTVRSSGYGVAYSLSIVLPALYPYYLPALQGVLGQYGAVAALLAMAGVLVAGGAAAGPEVSTREPLR
ncbi:MFS transporter [Cryobacterium melibiosiphilum]|uniref:MFS transporter n=1 Tax=Cryobacterium melibiosiphilum TaxID=995039 RepID=A0A3A5MPX1_9MICO|nr:MFS transporter [Cryobacterium melibiosiphilum]RJT92150.1 MFS transporter [Cryobacterium melibiosiphilum]